MALIKCPHCGNMISDMAPRCPKCGTQFTPAAQSNQPVPQPVSPSPMPPQPNVYQAPARETSGSSKTGLIIALVVAALLMAGGGYFGWSILTKNDSDISMLEQSEQSESSEQDETMAGTSSDKNRLEDHEGVDLGLSVKWASCNVGASSPSDCGDYYAWGELSPKSSYDEDNCDTYSKKMGNISGDPQYDVARAKWGGSWRLPTKAEIEELKTKCAWTWTSQGGTVGFKVSSPTTGNSIFLPITGFRNGMSLKVSDEYGCYWTSTPNPGNNISARYLYFNSEGHHADWYRRYNGFAIRPVM